jgi:hypothetical protein
MQDWTSFLKLDNAATIDFLTSYAAALQSEQLIGERSVENLKLSLATITPKLASPQSSVLPLLTDLDDEFIRILSARYGVIGLAWNHLRMSTRHVLAESCTSLAHWADQVLKKAELFMNRPFISHSHAYNSRRELFPSVLCHAAKILHDTATELKVVIHDLSLMRPADILDTLGQQYVAEHRIALQVGFSGLETETLSYCRTEQRALRRIIQAFDEMSFSILQIVAGLRENTATFDKMKELEAACEILAAECQHLSGLRFEVSSNIHVWETRRLSFLHEVFILNERMNFAAKLFTEALSPKDRLGGLDLLSSDVERAVVCSLIQGGAAIGDATNAARDLMNYCRSHNTLPASLIEAELKKINPQLRADTLALATTLTSDSLTATPGGSEAKSRFMETAKKIRKSLNVAMPFSTPLVILICGFIVGGCGVKKDVISEVIDPRPQIPFKSGSTTENLENKKASKPQDDKDKPRDDLK